MSAHGKTWFRFFSVFASVFLVSLALARSVSADPPAQTDPMITVPYTPSLTGLIYLPVQLTGTQGQIVNATFLLDSGASTSLISRSLPDKLGLVAKAAIGSDGKPILFNGKQSQMTEVPSFKIGALTVFHSSLIVIDESVLNVGMDQPVDGVIGANFLSVVPTLVDFAKSQVTFFGFGPLTSQDLQAASMEHSIAIPLTTDDYASYSCQVSLENLGHLAQTSLLVDTGASYSTLSSQTAKHLMLTPDGKTQSLKAPSGIVPTNFGGLETIGFPGGPLIHDLVIAYYPDDKTNDILAVHLGLDVLGRYRMLLDFPDRRMYLQPYPPVTASLSSASTDPPQVTLSLDGKTTGTFVINPSAEISSLSTSVAAKLQVTPTPSVGSDGKPIRVGGKQVPGVTLPQSNLNGQPLTNATFLVLDPAAYAPLGYPVDGILGLNVLESQACLLDMANRKIMLWGSNAFTPADLKGVDMADAVAVPLNEIPGTRQFSISVKLTNGKASQGEELALDTSHGANYISEKSVTKLKLSAVGEPLPISANGITYTISHVNVPDVSLGTLTLHDFYTSYADGAEPPGVLHHLGASFFSQNRVLFDFANKVMYVKPNPPSAPAAGTPPAPGTAPGK